MVRGPDQARPSRRNSSHRIALPFPATRSPCSNWGLNGGGVPRDRTCADRTAALKLDFDTGPQRLEIVVAQKLPCLREMLGQRNLGSIRQTNTGCRLICLRHRLACACWPGSHRFQRVPASCGHQQRPNATHLRLCRRRTEPGSIGRWRTSQCHDRLAGLRRWAKEACMLGRYQAGDATHGVHHDQAKEDD
jgi:hypothetical protein